jgi:SAM-dependent methyltransferase
MARIASQAKMGYYPTPPLVVEHVKNALSLQSPGPFRFLDTCCGEGEALNLLATGLDSEVETFGVELDETRLKLSSQKLHNVVWGDALTELRVSLKAFSLLWLNPPYDWAGDGEGRLEARFLEAHLKYLAPKGWLVFVIPLQALKFVKETLAKLSNLQVYAFPKPQYFLFKQLVVVGQKHPTLQKAEQLSMLADIAFLSDEDAGERLPETSEITPRSMVVPASPEGRITFSSERLELEKAAELAAKSPLWKDFEVVTAAKALNNIRPLAPLRQGHQAMLLAAGFMNGEVASNGRRLVIKGSVHKNVEVDTEVTDTHRIRTCKEKFQIIIRAIDLDTKEIFAIS